MKLLNITILSLLFALSYVHLAKSNEIVHPYKTVQLVTSDEITYPDRSRFYQAKSAVQLALENVAEKYQAPRYKFEDLTNAVSATLDELAKIKEEYPEVEYSVIANREDNDEVSLIMGMMSIIVAVEYKDEDNENKIAWKFQTVHSFDKIGFFVAVYDEKSQELEESYNWKTIPKIRHE